MCLRGAVVCRALASHIERLSEDVGTLSVTNKNVCETVPAFFIRAETISSARRNKKHKNRLQLSYEDNPPRRAASALLINKTDEVSKFLFFTKALRLCVPTQV